MTWLVLGANGQLGQELINLLKTRNIEAIGTDQKEIDFTKPNEIAEKLKKFNPSHIVNCGAYTQVDKAEEEPELANLINAQAVGVIAKFASEGKIPFVKLEEERVTYLQFSYDYYFIWFSFFLSFFLFLPFHSRIKFG